ncbi:MAG: TraR/DksA family transcriptional regulator [Desulfuromonadales bacterium]
MATQPEAKPEATIKMTPELPPNPDVKKTPKAASKMTPANPPKEISVEVKSKTAPKLAESSNPLAESVTAVPEMEPEAVQHSIPKIEVQTVAKAAHQITPKSQKWLEIRLILEKIKEDTLREITKSVKNGTDAVTTHEPGGDIYDQASSERDRELGLLLGDREREKLHSIDEALLRIDEDEYGICEECDDDIPLGRLKAMPFTRHCVKCKSDLEKLQAQTKRFEEDRAYREIPLGSEEEEA